MKGVNNLYVLFVARGYPTDTFKVNGVFEFDQAKALVKQGHKMIYAAVDLRSFRRKRKWGFESFIHDGVQVEAINIPCGRITKTLLNKIRKFALQQLVQRIEKKYGKPDVVHAHFLEFGRAATQVFQDKDIPIVLTEHMSSMGQETISPYLINIAKNTYPLVTQLITVGHSLSKNIHHQFGVSSKVIANMMDTSIFSYENKKISKSDFSFVTTAALIEGKAIDLLVHAFHRAFENQKNVYLYIFGEGTERKKIEKSIAHFGLADRIFLRGLVSRNEIAEQMKVSDCFVLPSRYETFGVAYIEAMAAGLPVITTKCGGPEDFVTEENGKIVPVDHLEELADAMIDIRHNMDRYDREKISQTTKDLFSPETIGKQITDVYLEIQSTFQKGVT
jgi:glycosyltransferase involved in cell wall biosynthesis